MPNAYRHQRGLPLIHNLASLALVAFIALSFATAAADEAASGERLSQTRKAGGDARDTGDYASVTTDEYGALETSADPDKSAGNLAKTGPATEYRESVYGDFWFYSVDVELFNDIDRDGYYHGIDVLFDADTIYSIADVYAVAYLSYEGGPWNEYAVSDDITLFGSTSTDDYVLVTELLQGYPPGRYDVLIELFESDTGLFVASVGPHESFELGNLPLEDSDYDQPVAAAPAVAVTRGGGGASSIPFLIALLGVVLLSCQRARWE